MSQSQREKLDVESSQARQARLGQLLSNISSPQAEDQTNGSAPSAPNPLPSKPFPVPQSDVLARVRAFLPTLQASNNELLARAAKDPESVDIEKVNGGQAIAMDLGLGVFDAPQDPRGDLGPIVDSQPPKGLSRDDEGDEEDEDSSLESTGGASTTSSASESDDEVQDQPESTAPGEQA